MRIIIILVVINSASRWCVLIIIIVIVINYLLVIAMILRVPYTGIWCRVIASAEIAKYVMAKYVPKHIVQTALSNYVQLVPV